MTSDYISYFSSQIFPCCKRNCECCEDGCCTCCADCDALVCCCLEIRLVSKGVPEENTPSAAKYIANDSKAEIYTNKISQNTSLKKNKTLSEADKFTNVGIQRTNNSSPPAKASGTKSNQSKTRSPTSIRSDSQLQLEYKKSNSKQQTTVKSASKMKPPQGVGRKSDAKSNTTGTRSLPGPPPLPPKINSSEKEKLKRGARKRTNTESCASELKEVSVDQKSALLYSHLYRNSYSNASGSFHGGPDLILGLPPSQAALVDTSSINQYSFSSLPPMSPGTIVDGSGTHRSSTVDSTFSVHFEDVNSLASPRPLPQLPGR